MALWSGLSRALCYTNTLREAKGAATSCRVLAVQRGADSPAKYVQTMNALFAAQSARVTVDGMVVRAGDSTYLQQAASLTGGAYLREADASLLVPLLVGAFLPEPALRASGQLAPLRGASSSAEARAACFCHKRPLDVGYVCSVCLSIFCDFVPVCTTCHAKVRPWRMLRGLLTQNSRSSRFREK